MVLVRGRLKKTIVIMATYTKRKGHTVHRLSITTRTLKGEWRPGPEMKQSHCLSTLEDCR